VEESSESGFDSDMDEPEESPISELWSDDKECEPKGGRQEESSESEAGSLGRSAGPNHLVKGCCHGPLGGAMVGAKGMGWSGGPYTQIQA
jgi:hypothetical protein